MRGLCTEGNLHFKINWASLLWEGNLSFLLCLTLYIRRGDLTEGFLGYDFGGLIFGGAYTGRGLFSEFYSMLLLSTRGRGDLGLGVLL